MSDDFVPADKAARTLRWAVINRSKKCHLWLGSAGSACGRDFHRGTLEAVEMPQRTMCCETCWAYAIGWIDGRRWDPSPQIVMGRRDPRGWNTAGIVNTTTTAVRPGGHGLLVQASSQQEGEVEEPGKPDGDEVMAEVDAEGGRR